MAFRFETISRVIIFIVDSVGLIKIVTRPETIYLVTLLLVPASIREIAYLYNDKVQLAVER